MERFEKSDLHKAKQQESKLQKRGSQKPGLHNSKPRGTKLQTSTPLVKVLEVDGITVNLTRKRIKNLNIRISPDGAQVNASAPLWMPEARVVSFVRSKRAWIERAMQRAAERPAAQAAEATPEQVAAWREVVEACVPPLVCEWEPILGVKAGKIVYRNMKSRWGSCQPSTGRICINVRLALYPPECLEYVVVHELCHLLVRGHGPDFYKLMDGVMPDWKQRRARLR